jgi:peptidyl-prolyl cis-trans isomerase D
MAVLQTLSNFTQGRYGKFFAALIFGLLIASFGIMGMNMGYKNQSDSVLAMVNDSPIYKQSFNRIYQSQIDRITRYLNAPPTPEQLESLALTPQILVRLITEALVDQQTHALKMTLPIETIWASVVHGPNFKDANGQFNRPLFEQSLNNLGDTKTTFLEKEKRALLRQQLADTLSAGLTPPKALEEKVHHYAAEERTLEYFMLPLESVGNIAGPTPDQLESYFQENALKFRAPEYRRAVLLEVSPSRLVPPDSIPQADVRSQYMVQKETRFSLPERREVQQIMFASLDDAQKAYENIKSGMTFDRVLLDNKISVEDSMLGKALAKRDLADDRIAETVFSIAPGVVSPPIANDFGFALVRVLKVIPGEIKSYEAVEKLLREEISAKKGSALLQERIAAIEDQRASAKSLEDIGADLNIAPQIIETDITGLNERGLPIESVSSLHQTLPALFRAQAHFDEEPVRLHNGGFVWFSVTHIEPSRDRTLEEVRPMVVKAWEDQERFKALEALAHETLTRSEKDETLTVLAKMHKTPLKSQKITRAHAYEGKISAPFIRQAFQTPVGQSGIAPVDRDGLQSWAVFRVKSAFVPPPAIPLESETRFSEAFPQEFLFNYINSLRRKVRVTLNEQSLTEEEKRAIQHVPFLNVALETP